MSTSIASIYRHPVKSLTAEHLEQVTLAPGQGVPNDRRFALSLGSTPIDGATTEWMPKSKFIALVRTEKLAALETRFDDETETLTVLRDGKQVSRGKLTDAIGRISIEEFFGAYLGDEAKGRPKVVEAEHGHVLSDVPDPVLSILNLASVKDLERVTQKPVDPLRFRANLWLEGLDPWEEFSWVGREVTIGGAKLAVTERIGRCPATNVDPASGERDMNIPKALMMGFRHQDMGVYARVLEGGEIRTGDAVEAGRPAVF